MNLTPTHLHLLLNHFPTIGFSVGLCLFIGALVSKSHDLKKASLLVFVGIALLTIPTYITGNAAAREIAQLPDVSKAAIDTHEGAAVLAFAGMGAVGLAAWLALWQLRRRSEVSTASLAAILVLSLVTMGLVARAASIGGEVRHPEIRTATETTTVEGALGRKIGTFVGETPWVWPAAETLHFIGLSLLIGVVLVFNLRVLGLMKQVPSAALDRFLPWAMLGFGLNILTGILFFIAKADQYTGNYAFYWKIWLAVAAGANALYFTIFDDVWVLKPGADASALSKVVVVSGMLLWVGVLYFGSMLPFLGDAF